MIITSVTFYRFTHVSMTDPFSRCLEHILKITVFNFYFFFYESSEYLLFLLEHLLDGDRRKVEQKSN